MDFIEQLQQLATKIPRLCEILQTEEATKNALIMPFISVLGYDVFDPTEVSPELVADVGTKKGEKVDYAIHKDGATIMLWECKKCGGDLNLNHASQLFRYFSVTDARIGVLTNGIIYRFYTDLEAPNKMDEKPFLEIDMLNLNEASVAALKRLSKPAFDLHDLLTAAGELKYTREFKRLLSAEADAPTDEFIKYFATKVFSGPMTPTRREYFGGLVKRSFHQFINDRINERLKNAMGEDEAVSLVGGANNESVPASDDSAKGAEDERPRDAKSLVETTEEELQGFYIVKALLRDLVDPKRIMHRDTQTYFGILLDNNNRKPLARLYFNRGQKYLGVFNEAREETRVPINDLNDIYEYAEQLRRVFAFYEGEKSSSKDAADGEE